MNVVGTVTALAVGVALGVVYFAGLWITVHRLAKSRRPALLLLGSFLLRAGTTVAGMYLVMDGRWEQLTACLVGFLLARTMVVACLGGRETAWT